MPETLDLRHLIKQCSECGQRFSPDAVFCPFDGTLLELGQRPADKLDPLVGQTLDGRYAIFGVIGEGGMGTVYRAKHVTLGRALAIKVLREDLAQEPELAERFLQEAQATAAVKHPNVVSITDFGRLPDNRPYFVMELLEGRTLASLLKAGGPLPPRAAARVVVELAHGLDAAHQAGVIHRDLKPENVFLVGPSGAEARDVRVVDFGAAMVLGRSRLTKKGVVFGTPYYMSPEQASGHDVDHRADIYSLGIILYELVTGRVPFEGETYMGVLTQHMFVVPTPPSRLSPKLAREIGPLEEVIMRALEKDPRSRYGSMAELASAIEDALSVAVAGPSWPAPAPNSSSPRGIADHLELPTLAELRGSVQSASKAEEVAHRRSLAFLVVGAVIAVCAAFVAIAVLRQGAPAAPVPSAMAVVSHPVVPETPTQPVPPKETASVVPPPAVSQAPAASRTTKPPHPAPPRSATPTHPVDGLGPDPFVNP